jgi:hypothetical protein
MTSLGTAKFMLPSCYHSPESVTCAHCQHVFHLSCLDPPLSQKPKIGYSWACAPCSKAYDDQVEFYMETGIAPAGKGTGSATLNGKGKGKEVLPGKGKGKDKEGKSLPHHWQWNKRLTS